MDKNQLAIHRLLLTYASRNYLMLQAPDDPATYLQFYELCKVVKLETYNYTPEMLRDEFMNKVLPNVDTYDMNNSLQRYFNTFALHPNFEVVEHGYVFKNKEDRVENILTPEGFIAFCSNIKQIDASEVTEEALAEGERLATLIMNGEELETRPGVLTSFDSEDAALLSATMSNNEELVQYTLFDASEIHRRLIAAKEFYEQYGKMSRAGCSFFDLMNKAEELDTLGEVVAQLYELKIAHDKHLRLNKKRRAKKRKASFMLD